MRKLTWNDIELGETIGAGTVGVVRMGRLKESDQSVAVKLLQRDISRDPLVRARFLREMTILEKLDHPHIIRYYGGGEHGDQLFYAMEAVTGGTAKDLLERYGSLSWREVASIARQVASALQHAHNHGIIHRDLKPANLFLDPSGRVKLGDFGIARDTHSADLTHTGLTVGTHAYMAPEQIRGDEGITGKADLYSLGCLLFELLCGCKPFQATNFAALFEQHLHQPAPRVTEFIQDCPDRLAQLIDRLLAKSPDDRPFNARAVQGEMLELLGESPRGRQPDPSADGRSAVPAHAGEAHSIATGERRNVAAAAVVDPGMKLLASKLKTPESPVVSWRALAALALAVVILVGLAAASRLWK